MPKIALFTTGLLHEPIDHPRSHGFVERIDAIFGAADGSEGFLGRDTEAAPWGAYQVPAIFLAAADLNRVPQTLSLWRDLASAFAFTYHDRHGEALTGRRSWFVRLDAPTHVLWWVPDEHTPTWAEGCARFEGLAASGPSQAAFTFGRPFDAGGRPITIDRAAVREIAARNRVGGEPRETDDPHTA